MLVVLMVGNVVKCRRCRIMLQFLLVGRVVMIGYAFMSAFVRAIGANMAMRAVVMRTVVMSCYSSIAAIVSPISLMLTLMVRVRTLRMLA